MVQSGELELRPGAGEASQARGLYVYCVAPGSEETGLGPVGLDGRPVHTLACEGLCALVHDCSAQPYQSRDPEVVAAWVLAHHQVVEAAWKRWGTVLPLTFNTIIRAEQGDAEEALTGWLKEQREALTVKLKALAGKSEYAVQVFWDSALVAKLVTESCPEIRKLGQEMASKPRGLAYMYGQQLERLLAREMEALATERCQAVYGCLSRWTDNVRLEKLTRGEDGRRMLINLSCLVPRERCAALKSELDQVGNRAGYSVRLAGPLPPYSFC